MTKITIVTVCFNAESIIEETIKSVLAQDYPNYEYIIIDGKSTDGTLQIIEKYKGSISMVVSEQDSGIYDAMNKGIALSSGDWINFMNAGDTFCDSSVLSQFATGLTMNYEVAYGDAMFKYPNKTFLKKAFPLNVLEKGMAFCHQSTFVRTEWHKAHPFDLKYKYSADYNFLYTTYKKGGRFLYIPVTIANYECVDGVSAKRRVEGHREGTVIRGENLTLKGKLNFKIWLLKFYAKDVVKKFFPSVLIDSLR